METCRTRSGEKHGGGARQFRGNSRQKLARVRESSCWEAEPKIEKQELPLHCAVSKQPDPGKEERSSSHPPPNSPELSPARRPKKRGYNQ